MKSKPKFWFHSKKLNWVNYNLFIRTWIKGFFYIKKPFNIEKYLLFATLNLIQFRNDVSKQILWILISMFKYWIRFLNCLVFNIKSQIIRNHDLCISQGFYINHGKKFPTKIKIKIIFPKNNSMNSHKHVEI